MAENETCHVPEVNLTTTATISSGTVDVGWRCGNLRNINFLLCQLELHETCKISIALSAPSSGHDIFISPTFFFRASFPAVTSQQDMMWPGTSTGRSTYLVAAFFRAFRGLHDRRCITMLSVQASSRQYHLNSKPESEVTVIAPGAHIHQCPCPEVGSNRLDGQ